MLPVESPQGSAKIFRTRPEECPEGEDREEWSKSRVGKPVMYYASRVPPKKEQNLRRVFRLGLDAHLVTGL